LILTHPLVSNHTSNACENGPWPRSWHKPASWIIFKSLLLISSSGCVSYIIIKF